MKSCTRSLVLEVVALSLGLAVADQARAVSCTTGKTAVQVYSGTATWSPANATQYGKGNGIWTGGASGDSLKLQGSIEACWFWGGFSGIFTPSVDADTYYACTATHGYSGSGPCYAFHPAGSPSAIAPQNSAGSVIEKVQIVDQADGVSILEASGPVTVRSSRIVFTHDDAVEDDWCTHDVTVDDLLLDKVFMAFAWDKRGAVDPDDCVVDREWSITNSLVRLHRFAHAYEEKPGHGGVFKDDGDGHNPEIADFSNNVILLGPVAGQGQVQFPLTTRLGTCSGNVYLWNGTQAAYDDMLDTGESEDFETNGERLAELQASWPGCITVVLRGPSETEAQFLNRTMTELGGKSWNQLVAAFYSRNFPSSSCGIGFELVALAPLLRALAARRRRT